MDAEEHELIKTEVKLAVLEGIGAFAETSERKTAEQIRGHAELCRAQRGNGKNGDKLSDKEPIFAWLFMNWRSVAIALVIVSWLISSLFSAIKGQPQKFTPEMVKQIAQQVQQVNNPTIITNEEGQKKPN